jgi:hypothetical protein
MYQDQSSRTMFRVTIAAMLLTATVVESAPAWKKIPGSLVIQSRRMLNFGGLFGSATQASPYERITAHPVFRLRGKSYEWKTLWMNMSKRIEAEDRHPGVSQR